jgi:hypothetical protein
MSKLTELLLDEKIEETVYDQKRKELLAEGERVRKEITKHEQADPAGLENSLQLLELVQDAVILYKNQSNEEKRKLLQIVHSNSTWRDGEFHPSYRKPFDLLVVTNIEY